MKYLAYVLLFISMQVAAGPKLYVFDCGTVSLESLEMFSIQDNESTVRELFVPCYVIKHEKGMLFWDGGLPKTIPDAGGSVPTEGGNLVYRHWIVDQLAGMGIQPDDFTHAAYSHLHFDHAGAASAIIPETVLMQQLEWDGLMTEGRAHVDPSLLAGLKQTDLTMIDGDYDVFGDGSVKLIFAPGHTPGHQVLWVDLENMGPLILSGDLYHTRANRKLRRVPTFNDNVEQTLASMDKIEAILAETGATFWIEHDKALADTLNMAPAYYD